MNDNFTPDKWIQKAVAKGSKYGISAREWMTVNWGSFACDGIRIHYDHTIPPRDDTDGIIPNGYISKIVEWVSEDETIKHCATFPNPTALLKAARACRKTKTKSVTLKVSKGVTHILPLDYEHPNDITFAIDLECTYENRTAYDEKIQLNAKYLIDALSGMDKDKELHIRHKREAVHITDGTRVAYIMRVHAP